MHEKKLERREFLRTATGAVLLAGVGGALGMGNVAWAAQQAGRGASAGQARQAGTFNPLQDKGMPIEKQVRNWSELSAFEYDKQEVDPYTRCRIITMNGVEVGAAIFKHQMARMVEDYSLLQALAMSRRIEQQQQKAVNGLIPGNETTLENTVGYEQVAVDLTAWCARNEPDEYMREAYNFALLEDFDHLYRYSNLLDMKQEKHMKPERIVGRLTEIMPGRPTISEHRHPFDSIRKPADMATAEPITLMNIMSLVAAEQQTMNFYMNVLNRSQDKIQRDLYSEIGMIEEQHVSHYESLMPRNCSWLQCAVMHELHECWLYNAFMEQEVDPRVKKMWEIHLDMELGHLQNAIALYKKFERKDPAEFMPESMPQPMTFESNIDYLREVLEKQTRLTADGPNFVLVDDLPRNHRFFAYQRMINKGGAPSQQVVKAHIDKQGEDYRFETAQHPLERFRDRKSVPEY